MTKEPENRGVMRRLVTRFRYYMNTIPDRIAPRDAVDEQGDRDGLSTKAMWAVAITAFAGLAGWAVILYVVVS